MNTHPHCRLRCLGCGREYIDRRLGCDACPHALLRAVYDEPSFAPSRESGIFRFACWLPGRSSFATTVGPAILDAPRYGRRLGLKRLTMAFNGYWPERGAFNVTASFKDLEASPTIAYLRDQGISGIVLASAGNTARAFANAASEAGFPCLIVVPERMAHRLWLPRRPAACVQAVVLRGDSYNAAIRVSQRIAERLSIAHEGGVRNVARRDGMGTTVLEYARVTGELPRHYVQAVGSGAGGIAAYEAGLRLVADGRFGSTLPKLHLVQNSPITPIHDQWTAACAGASDRIAGPAAGAVQDMYADVLANFQPAYALDGGVRTALAETGGATYAVTYADALRAKADFEGDEGTSINEAAACACAGLEQAVRSGRIDAADPVLLNITGGGDDRVRRDFVLHSLETGRVVDECDLDRLDLTFASEPVPVLR